MNGCTMNETTFKDLLDRTRELAALGQSWGDVWQSLRPSFRRLVVDLSEEETGRAFEAVLAAFSSNDDAPVEPIGTTGMVAGGTTLKE